MFKRTVILLLLFYSKLTNAQLIENFDGCDRAPLEADCWLFNACNITPLSNNTSGCVLISSPSVTDTSTATSPALLIPLGQRITFSTRFWLTKTSASFRKVQVFLWDIEKNTRLLLNEYAYASDPQKQSTQPGLFSKSFELPKEWSGKCRLIFFLIGNGGDSQLVIDDVSLIATAPIRRLDEAGSCKGQSVDFIINNLTATADVCRIRLTWSISQGSTAASFSVQHSTNGTEFRDIAPVSVAGQGTNQPYAYVDTEPSLNNYYRIKQLDLRGKTTFSNVVQIADPCEGTRISITQSSTNVFVIKAHNSNTPSKTVGQAQLINVQGIILKSKPLIIDTPVIFDCAYLPIGTYVIRINNENKTSLIRQKITIY
jgi:hypothetical protein